MEARMHARARRRTDDVSTRLKTVTYLSENHSQLLLPCPLHFIPCSCDRMDISGDDIAEVVLREVDKWPAKRKPLVRSDGVREWVPLSGIVAHSLFKAPEMAQQITGLIIEIGRGSLTCLAAAYVCIILYSMAHFAYEDLGLA